MIRDDKNTAVEGMRLIIPFYGLEEDITKVAASGIGDTSQIEKGLNRAVFSSAAVKREKNNVHLRETGRFGQRCRVRADNRELLFLWRLRRYAGGHQTLALAWTKDTASRVHRQNLMAGFMQCFDNLCAARDGNVTLGAGAPK